MGYSHSEVVGNIDICVFVGEQVTAECFMEELDNGVKLCRLVGILQSKIPQDSETQVRKEGVTRG